jgi:hypothetical protein
VHAPCEVKSDDVKDSFYKELGRVFDQFPRYDMKILLGDLNAKVVRENIFKPSIGNEISHEISNNGVRVVNFTTSKHLVVKSTMFPHHSIHKYCNEFAGFYSQWKFITLKAQYTTVEYSSQLF